MIEPTREDIGRRVVYRSRCGHIVEQGVITGFNERVVWVRYGDGSAAAATFHEDLEWAPLGAAEAAPPALEPTP